MRLYLPLLLGLAACQSPTLTTIQIDYNDTVVVEGSGLLGDLITTLGFDGFADMNITDAEELANQGVEPGDVRDVRLVSFELEAISPSNPTFRSFIHVGQRRIRRARYCRNCKPQ